jgi:hypothetical protein
LKASHSLYIPNSPPPIHEGYIEEKVEGDTIPRPACDFSLEGKGSVGVIVELDVRDATLDVQGKFADKVVVWIAVSARLEIEELGVLVVETGVIISELEGRCLLVNFL